MIVSNADARFASPKGILGEIFVNPFDTSQERTLADMETWAQWQTRNNFMLSTESFGQTWEVQFSSSGIIRSNIIWLPENSLPRTRYDTTLEVDASPLVFVLEGPLFGPSGIAQVCFQRTLEMLLVHFHQCLPSAHDIFICVHKASPDIQI